MKNFISHKPVLYALNRNKINNWKVSFQRLHKQLEIFMMANGSINSILLLGISGGIHCSIWLGF